MKKLLLLLCLLTTLAHAQQSGSVYPKAVVDTKLNSITATVASFSATTAGKLSGLQSATTALDSRINSTTATLSSLTAATASLSSVQATQGTTLAAHTATLAAGPATNSITNAKLATAPALTFKGNNTTATAGVVDLGATETRIVLGLDQVNNTSDAGKPVSGPQATAIATKLDVIASTAALSSYTGTQTQVVLPSGMPYNRVLSSATVDGVTSLSVVGASAYRWLLAIPDRRLTPQLFGAIPDDGNDDGAALQAWLTAAGTWEHYLPAGIYDDASTTLTRTNMGALTLTGAGIGRSIIRVSGDVSAMIIANPRNGNYGAIVVQGIEFQSTGTKSAGKEALLIRGQHDPKIHHRIENVAFRAQTVGQEWGSDLHVDATSFVTYQGIDALGASQTATTGIYITNETNYPSVEHLIYNPQLKTIKTGIQITGTGYPAIEGVQIFSGNIVSPFQGIVATSAGYSAPHFSVFSTHINTAGGEAIYFDNLAQPVIFGGVFYVDKNATSNTVPSRGVYLKNPVGANLDFFIATLNNTANAVYFDGAGGGNNKLSVVCNVSSALTNVVNTSAASAYSVEIGTLKRIWDGNTTWGTTQGSDVVGTVVMRPLLTRSLTVNPAAGSIPQYNYTDYGVGFVSPAQASAGSFLYTGTSSATLNMSTTNVVQLDNGSTNVTHTIDLTKLTSGQPLTFVPLNNTSTGTVTLTSSNSGVNGFYQRDGSLSPTLVLPTGPNHQATILQWNGGNFHLIYYPTLADQKSDINASFTLTPADWGKNFFIGTAGLTITVPANTLPDGFWCTIEHNGLAAGSLTTVSPGSGAYVNGSSGYNKVISPASTFGSARLQKRANNWFTLTGSISN